MTNKDMEVIGIVPGAIAPPSVGDDFTIFGRLLLELNQKMYYDEQTYMRFLREENLDGSMPYDKSIHYLPLLETVYTILHTLANNIDLYRKIETEFVTQGEAITSLNKRLDNLQKEIKRLKLEKSNENSDFSFMFFTR